MSVSYSAYDTHRKCGRKYGYKYIQHLPEIQGEAAARGTIIHAQIEAYIGGQTEELPPELERWRAYFDKLYSLEQKYLEFKFAVDRDFKECSWADGWIRAVYDVIALPDASMVQITDWKTGKHRLEHAEQGELYGILALIGVPQAAEAEIHFVYVDTPNLVVTNYIDRKDLEQLKKRWGDRFDYIEQLTMESLIARPGPLCGWCSYSKRSGGPCEF